MGILQRYIDPSLAVTFFWEKKTQTTTVSISVPLYLDTEVRNTCSDTGWHCSVSRMRYPYFLSETSPVQSVAVQFNEGLARSASMFIPALDSALGFSKKYSF